MPAVPPTDGGGHPLDPVVDGVRARNATAYARLYDLTADRLYAIAYRLLADRQEAEDAVQQVFLHLARLANPPQRGTTLESWLLNQVQEICLQVTRKQTRPATILHRSVPDVDGEDQYDLGLDPHLEAALALLTSEQRLVIHLKHVEGLDGHQIAEITGTSRMAVYAMATRAERRLRHHLGAVEQTRPRPPRRTGGR